MATSACKVFLGWFRNFIKVFCRIEDSEHFILTPFERNIEIWRQLWRVLELSDVIIQIVDSRNPEVFYCPDLIIYAKELNPLKESILLLNKADLLTESQRDHWSTHFKSKGVNFLFYSALTSDSTDVETEKSEIIASLNTSEILSSEDLLNVLQLNYPNKTVGLVGYPNVGKSSTINSLLGEKKVAVAMTPGKTKHYQVFYLTDLYHGSLTSIL